MAKEAQEALNRCFAISLNMNFHLYECSELDEQGTSHCTAHSKKQSDERPSLGSAAAQVRLSGNMWGRNLKK